MRGSAQEKQPAPGVWFFLEGVAKNQAFGA